MHLRSDSFKPYARINPEFAFGKHDDTTHFTFAGNRNPHLAWSGIPQGTRSFAILCWDPDVPSVGDDVNQEGKTVPLDLPRADFFHWVLTDLPATTSSIAAGSQSEGVTPKGKPLGQGPSGGIVGINSYTDWFAGNPDMAGDYAGYDGPAPPWNDERLHGYRFAVYALDTQSLGLSGRFGGPELRAAMEGHVLASAMIIGLYAINPALN